MPRAIFASACWRRWRRRKEFDLIFARERQEPQESETTPQERNSEDAATAAGDGACSKAEIFEMASCTIDKHLTLLQKRDPRELAKVLGKTVEEAQHAIDFIRTLTRVRDSDTTVPTRD